MKLISAGCMLLGSLISGERTEATHAKNEPLEPTPSIAPTLPLGPIDDSPLFTAAEAKADVFTPVGTGEPVVVDIVDRFLELYVQELGHTSLLANISSILKAEQTDVRGEMMEKELDSGGLGIDFVEETQSQRYRIFVLMKYQFNSAMLGHNRPYVTVMRLTMDCYNTTGDAVDAATEEQTEYDATTETQVRLACDVLEHIDVPRRNESIKSIPSYIQRQIYRSAPGSFKHNHSLHIFYDAIEAQDLVFDGDGSTVVDRDTMHYVRFRVQGGNSEDCVIAIEHTKGINTLRYQDTVCYDEADTALAVVGSAKSQFALTSANALVFVLIASLAGAFVAAVLLWRQRKRQRSGYSYVHSGTSKLSHAPSQVSGPTNTDAAIAC